MGAGEVLQIVLKVEFFCQKCKVLVMKAITKLMGIDKIEINAEKSTVTVTGCVDPVAVVAQIRKVGKMVKIVTVGPPPKPEEKKKEEVPCCKPHCCDPCCKLPCCKPKPPCEPGCMLPCCKPLPPCCKYCEHISVTVEPYGKCAIM